MFTPRLILNNIRRNLHNHTRMINSSSMVDLSVDNDGIAILTMQKKPVNTLSLEMIQELTNAFDEVEKNKYKGLILTSALSTVFSAGLDINEMYKPDMKRLEQFHIAETEMWIKLYGSKFITAAAINGHAPAGGCLLALGCEYRVIVEGEFIIGLNESKLGIVATDLLIDMISHTIPLRQAEIAVTTGKLFTVEEALKVGLVDESAKNKEDAIEKCKKFIKQFDDIPPIERAITKLKIRDEPLKRIQKNKLQNKQEYLEKMSSPSTQRHLEEYMKKLKLR